MGRFSTLCIFAACTAWMLSSPAQAERHQNSILSPQIGLTLKVAAGNKVRENASSSTIDTIYKQSFTPACDVVQDIGPFDEFPFSGPAKSGLSGLFPGQAKLHTTIALCPATSIGPPDVKVKWRILGAGRSGISKWTGFDGDVTLSMPSEVGAYTVEFTYTINHTKKVMFTRKLFVTKKAPLAMVNPPRRAWYEKATDWAAGESGDPQILKKLLSGLYAAGGASWRYGYFGPVSSPGLPCAWEDLVADPIVCDYADCFALSDVFENMAATLGVGGLSPVSPLGAYNLGFVTAGDPSIDPAFPGNASPLSGGGFDRYVFTSHSLRKRGLVFPKYYDATFDQIYGSSTAFIAYNLDGGNGLDADGSFLTTEEGAKVYERAGTAYDSWGTYEYSPPPPLRPWSAGASPRSVVRQAVPPFPTLQGLAFTGQAAFHTKDDDSDGLAEGLVADVEVETTATGEFSFVGLLQGAGTVIAQRPRFESMQFSRFTLNAAPGTHIVTLLFSGEQIFRSGSDGPYDLRVLGRATDGSSSALSVTTPTYAHTQFGETGAALGGAADAPIDVDGDGKHDYVDVTASVNVRSKGEYRLQGILSRDGQTIVASGGAFVLDRGTRVLTLRFAGRSILRFGLDGPFDSTVNLIDGRGHTIGGLEFATQPYAAAQFGALLSPYGSVDNRGVDTNSNGLFDRLRVEFGADIATPGTYRLVGALRNQADPGVVFAETAVSLASGPQQLTLDFMGPLIRAQEIKGPYEIEVVLRDPGTLEELDRVTLGRITAAYDFADFDPIGAADVVPTGPSSNVGSRHQVGRRQ